MTTYEKLVLPPLNYAMVESGVYRSGFPNKRNFSHLQQLGLRSILYLCHHEYKDDNLRFLEEQNIQLFHCPIDGNKEPFMGIDPEAMVDALHHILDVRNHPILVHCTKGTVSKVQYCELSRLASKHLACSIALDVSLESCGNYRVGH